MNIIVEKTICIDMAQNKMLKILCIGD